MEAWSYLRLLETEPAARSFLQESYQKKGLAHAERLAFQQSTRFLYTWKQARLFYESAGKAALSIRPLLLFYGCIHLLKGWLIVMDPDYPQNSKVLQHGVTTRKVKRSHYQFLKDEVRPQKEGLFSHLAGLLTVSPLQDRYGMRELFSYLPALREPLQAVTDFPSPWVAILSSKLVDQDKKEELYALQFPSALEGALAFSEETFRQFFKRFLQSDSLPSLQWLQGQKTMAISSSRLSVLEDHPLLRCQQGTWYFWNGDNGSLPLPEWATHYLLLYVLSMLSRYDTECWGELVLTHSYSEQFLIETFLDYHEKVFATVIMGQMQKNNT
ncbi:YaaC family protein [Brevibacillus ruminantium]|uniref:YaaC family protein n=1 Tax=Brevibacillus ruminantium TaxID=2950604 RepID=A0ABY4WGI7_9BACL|nr:YaaC family protein [Brevibacillus ruminantium]USG65819.1 YaaC family protein [Brevibacillus ruminantium]